LRRPNENARRSDSPTPLHRHHEKKDQIDPISTIFRTLSAPQETLKEISDRAGIPTRNPIESRPVLLPTTTFASDYHTIGMFIIRPFPFPGSLPEWDKIDNLAFLISILFAFPPESRSQQCSVLMVDEMPDENLDLTVMMFPFCLFVRVTRTCFRFQDQSIPDRCFSNDFLVR
jgi:hypothetical protein